MIECRVHNNILQKDIKLKNVMQMCNKFHASTYYCVSLKKIS